MPVTEGSDLYFFALMTDTVTQTAVHALKNEMLEKFGCKAALRSEAHITLIPPFRWSRIGTPILMQTVRQIEIHSSEFEIQLEGFGHFQSRVLFVQPIQNIHLY